MMLLFSILQGKCDYVECKYTEWTSWNPACGKNMERKRTLQTIKKSAERESCSGLKTTCTGDAEQSEKKDELCKLIPPIFSLSQISKIIESIAL